MISRLFSLSRALSYTNKWYTHVNKSTTQHTTWPTELCTALTTMHHVTARDPFNQHLALGAGFVFTHLSHVSYELHAVHGKIPSWRNLASFYLFIIIIITTCCILNKNGEMVLQYYIFVTVTFKTWQDTGLNILHPPPPILLAAIQDKRSQGGLTYIGGIYIVQMLTNGEVNRNNELYWFNSSSKNL